MYTIGDDYGYDDGYVRKENYMHGESKNGMYTSHGWHGWTGVTVITIYQAVSFIVVVRWRKLDYSGGFLGRTMGDAFLSPKVVGFTTGFGNLKVYLSRYIHPFMGYASIMFYSRQLFTGSAIADWKREIGYIPWVATVGFTLVFGWTLYAIVFGARGM